MALLSTRLRKIIFFILAWIMTGGILSLNKPMPKQPNEHFYICVMQNQQPINILFKDYKNESFCETELKSIPMKNPHFYFHLNQINDEWEMTTFTDSMADPFIYRYKIENYKAVPLWYNYGERVWYLSIVIISLFLTTLFFQAYKIFRKIFSQNPHSKNQAE